MEFAGILAGVARRSYAARLNGAWAMLRCRTAQDVIAVQAGMLCDELELVRDSCVEISDTVAASAAEAVRLIGSNQGELPANTQPLA